MYSNTYFLFIWIYLYSLIPMHLHMPRFICDSSFFLIVIIPSHHACLLLSCLFIYHALLPHIIPD